MITETVAGTEVSVQVLEDSLEGAVRVCVKVSIGTDPETVGEDTLIEVVDRTLSLLGTETNVTVSGEAGDGTMTVEGVLPVVRTETSVGVTGGAGDVIKTMDGALSLGALGNNVTVRGVEDGDTPTAEADVKPDASGGEGVSVLAWEP